MSITVTATQGGTGTEGGIALQVKVLTGAAAIQNGATGSDGTTLTAGQKSITPNATGSYIYGAVTNGASSTAFTANGSTTFFQNVPDVANGDCFGTFRATSTTTLATPVTVGASAPSGQAAGTFNWCAAEILASGTLAEDASSPAGVSSTSATTVSTASFVPPAGSLLVAMVSSGYAGSGTLTMTVSGGGLTWTQIASETTDLASVWIAQIQTPGGHVSLSFSSGRTSWNLGGPVNNPTAGPAFLQAVTPARARSPLAPRGRVASSQGAPVQNPLPPSNAGPPFYPARQAIRARIPQAAPRGRVFSSPPAPVNNPTPGPVFRQKPAPVRFVLPSWQPRAGRIGSSFGAPVINPHRGPPVYAPLGPARARLPLQPLLRGRVTLNPGGPVRNPSQGPVFYPAVRPARTPVPQVFSKGKVAASTGSPPRNPVAGPAFRQAATPARIRPALPPRGRIASNPGTPIPPPVVTAAPFYPFRFPVRIRPSLPPRGRVNSGPGSPVRNPQQGAAFPAWHGPAQVRFPELGRTGRTNSNTGAPVRNPVAGPPVRALRQPVRAPVPGTFSKGRIRSNPGTSSAVTYYVSATGSDSNNGLSPATPWQTIGKVNSTTLIPGDTVLFHGGDTFSGTELSLSDPGTTANPITIGSYGAGNATISNGSADAIFVNNVGGYVIENLTVTATSGGTAFTGIEGFCSGTGQLPSITITDCTCSGWNYGVIFGGQNATDGWNGFTVTGCTFTGNVSAGLSTYCEAAFNPASPQYNFQNALISNCVAHDNLGSASITTEWSGTGIVLGVCNGGTITGCTAYNNGADNGSSDVGPVGIFTYTSNNVTITDCVAYNNQSGTNVDGDGFDIDIDCTNCTIEYCVSYGNGGAGILAYGGVSDTFWSGNTIRYNLTWGNAQNTGGYGEISLIGNLANANVYNNTCVARDNGGVVPQALTILGGTPAALSGITVRNNILYAQTGLSVYADVAYTIAELLLQGNSYWNTSGAFGVDWNSTVYTTLASFRSGQSGQESVSGHGAGQWANPQLIAPGTTPAVTSPSNLAPANGLKLAPHSPAAAQGLNLSALFSVNPGTQDVFGNTLAYPLWIGAYQGLLVPPAGAPVRTRIPQPQPHPRAGRITSNAGAPVGNPIRGPVFHPAVRPAAARLPIPFRKGRTSSSTGAPVQNPGTGPAFTQAVHPARAVIPQVFSKGRTGSNPGSSPPAPATGPGFRQATSAVRVHAIPPPRGRVASNAGAPVAVPVPTTGPVFRQRVTPARSWVRPGMRGRAAFNPGAPVQDPQHGGTFPAWHRPVRAPVPRPWSKGRTSGTGALPPPVAGHATISVGLTLTAGPESAWQYIGPVPLTYLQYEFTAGGTLVVSPGETTEMDPASGYPYQLAVPPPDGRWIIAGSGMDLFTPAPPRRQEEAPGDDSVWIPPPHLAHLPPQVLGFLAAKELKKRRQERGEP